MAQQNSKLITNNSNSSNSNSNNNPNRKKKTGTLVSMVSKKPMGKPKNKPKGKKGYHYSKEAKSIFGTTTEDKINLFGARPTLNKNGVIRKVYQFDGKTGGSVRVTIPIEVARRFNLKKHSNVLIIERNDGIVIKPVTKTTTTVAATVVRSNMNNTPSSPSSVSSH